MMSACIFTDTLRKDTQTFFIIKISIFEIYLHPIIINFAPYFLTWSTLTRNAGTSEEILLDEKWIINTRNSNHFFKVNFYYSTAFSQSLKWWSLDQFLRNPMIRLCLMWSNRTMNQVPSDSTRRLSSTPQRCQETIPGEWRLYHPLHRLGHKSLQSTLTRIWTNNAIWIWTAATDYSTKLEQSQPAAQSIHYPSNNGGSKPYSRRTWRKLQHPITGAVGTVTDIDGPDEPQDHRGMGDTRHDDEWHYTLLFRWTQKNLFSTLQSVPPAATSKTEKTAPWNVLPKKRESVAARLRSLWTVAPRTEGHTRLVVNKLKNSILKSSYIYITKFSIFLYKGYIVVTYPPHAHICDSCKRYVAVIYRSIKVILCKSMYLLPIILVYWSGLGWSN